MATSRTLYLLGLQYELAMLIGKGIVLEIMLREFFPLALRRLGCRSAYVWLDDGGGSQSLRYAYPRSERKRGEPGGNLAAYANMGEKEVLRLEGEAGQSDYLYSFRLGTVGRCLLVRNQKPLEVDVETALIPLMARLGDACAACLEHENARVARETLAQKERHLRETILENSVVGIAFLNPDGRLVWTNKEMDRIFGADLVGLGGASLEPFYFSREEYLRVGAAVSAAVKQGQSFVDEVRMRRANGDVFWVHLSGKAVNAGDLSRGTVWVVMDITRRRELEDALRRKTAEQEIILQSTQIGIAHTANRVHQWVNSTFADMVGYASEELIGHLSRVHFPDDESFNELGATAYPLMVQGEAFAGERKFRRKNGEIFPVQMFARAVDPGDPTKGAIWTVMDLTEQRRLEAELQRNARERELILESTLVGIIYSRERQNQWVNETFARMLGYEPDELIGQSSRIQFPSEDSWQQFGEQAYPTLAADSTFSAEWELARRDGSTVWVHIIGKAVDPAQPSNASIWTLVDTSQRKQAEENMRLAIQQQMDLNNLKTRFVSMTSHEFRTPLATILSSTELLRHYADRLPKEEQTEILVSVENAVKRMTEMLDNILVIGRADSDMLVLNAVAVDVVKLCRELVEEAVCALTPDGSGLKRLQFQVDCPPTTALLDEKLLRHILSNIVTNAYKYSPAGGTVTVQIAAAGDQLRFIVKDQGIGIPEEDLPRLFESFHRATNVGNIAGTGLGMAIVKRAAEAHGGTVSVTSQLGVGTTFTVLLPSSVPSNGGSVTRPASRA